MSPPWRLLPRALQYDREAISGTAFLPIPSLTGDGIRSSPGAVDTQVAETQRGGGVKRVAPQSRQVYLFVRSWTEAARSCGSPAPNWLSST
jgi:hypothetical protein